jgi:hypothetical protein
MKNYITQKVTSGQKKMLMVYSMQGTLQATKTYNFNVNEEAFQVLGVNRADCIELSETNEISSKDFNFYKKYPNLLK